MNKLLLKGVAAAFCMATMFGTTACGDDDDLVNVEPPVEETLRFLGGRKKMCYA